MMRRFFYPRRTRRNIQTDVDEELRFHLDSRQQDLVARGETNSDARLQALREFGDLDDAREYLRNLDQEIESLRRRKDYMSDLLQDLRFAMRSLGSDASIIRQSLILGGEAYRVLSVMPPQFAFPATTVEIHLPFSTIPDNAIPRIRPVRIMNVVARLAPGVTPEQARAEMTSITRELATRYPESNAVQRLVIQRGMLLAVTGAAAGIGSALLLSRYIEGLLYGIASTDVMTYVSVAVALPLIAGAASLIPARRASRVDPLVALQPE